MTDISASAVLERRRRRLGLSVEDCWAAYFEMGGHREFASLRDFLRGESTFPETEIDILAAAISDLAPAPDPTLWSAATQTTRASSDAGVPGGSGEIAEVMVERLNSDLDNDRVLPAFWGDPVKLTDVEMLIHSGRLTSVRTIPPWSEDASLVVEKSAGGSLLRLGSADTAEWEMHPSGDELLILMSGTARVEIDRSNSTTAILRRPYEVCVIPRGRWHRHVASADDTEILFLTPTETIS